MKKPISLEDWFWYELCYALDEQEKKKDYAKHMAEQFREDLKEGKVRI